ncbi:MAG: adenylate kinase [Candidatus Bilamarchaeaceae archaeon]
MIIVMGVPGAGKTTVLNGLKENARILNYGTLMFEVAAERYGIAHRDEIRKLPVDKQRAVQKEVAEKLAKEKGLVVLDTHCSVKTSKGYLPGLPFELLEKLDVDAVVLITAKPEEIFRRRQNDKTRMRSDDATLESLKEHDAINKALLAIYAAHRGCPAKIIYNSDGQSEKASEELQKIIS